ncbi:hypothetical protein VU596_24690, partial [Enterobacter kobei]
PLTCVHKYVPTPFKLLTYTVCGLPSPWSVYRTLQGTVFLLNIASLLKANISTLNAVRLLNRFSSPWMQERLAATKTRYNKENT